MQYDKCLYLANDLQIQQIYNTFQKVITRTINFHSQAIIMTLTVLRLKDITIHLECDSDKEDYRNFCTELRGKIKMKEENIKILFRGMKL